MAIEINQALRLKSLVFWLDRVNKLDDLAWRKKCWQNKDYKGYHAIRPTCDICNGSPTFDPKEKGEPVIIHGMTIDRIQCYCLTLEHLSFTASRWYESTYVDTYLKDLVPMDIPVGAEKRTKEIKDKIGKFLQNPTRSALINGNPGSGKSHLLQSIKTAFGGFAVYITASDYFQRVMQYTKERDDDDRLGKFIDELTYAPVLLFDDYGLGHDSPYPYNVLAGIINNRYERKRYAPTIMTTNLRTDEIQSTLAVEGSSIGNAERLLSRMIDSENSTWMTTKQADYRRKDVKKEAGL